MYILRIFRDTCTGACTPNDHTFFKWPCTWARKLDFSTFMLIWFLLMKLRPRDQISPFRCLYGTEIWPWPKYRKMFMYPKWSKLRMKLWDTCVNVSKMVGSAWFLIDDVSLEPLRIKQSYSMWWELKIRGNSGYQMTLNG